MRLLTPPPSNSEKKITTFADYYFRNEEQKTETIKAFNDIFLSKSYLNSDVDFFLNGTNNEEYNLVLCTNFFHLFEDIKYIETLLDKIANLINPKTVVFFQVETKKWFNYELYLKLIITKFNGTVFEMYENNTLKESCFINLCK